VRLPSVKSAPVAGAHNISGIGYRCWPVKPLPEGVSNKGLGHQVVLASPRVDFSQQFLTFVDGDAPLEDSHEAASVQLLFFPK
jgi:hypothetical protein